MRLKLDENVDFRVAWLLRDAGHELASVQEEALQGEEDQSVYEHCIAEGRVLVTLDLDFSNVLRYPPEPTPGIVVLRGPNDLFGTVRILVRTLIGALATVSPRAHLWIVEPARLRIHQSTLEPEA
jgi:predicted nuclease of predicted toxin-antitoxin system